MVKYAIALADYYSWIRTQRKGLFIRKWQTYFSLAPHVCKISIMNEANMFNKIEKNKKNVKSKSTRKQKQWATS